MFVYNKGKLVRSVIPVSQDEFIFRLNHVTSGMTIEVKYNANTQSTDSPYKVYKEVDGSYVIYEEFYKNNKTTKENFEEAILFFEDNIYKLLEETPPVVGTPKSDDAPPPETFQEVPIVGDIVQVGSKFGVVTDVIDTQVVTKELSKDEAMRILKNQKNAFISIAQAGNTTDDLDLEIPSFDDGGSISSSIIFDTQKDKIIILRVKPPQTGGTPPPEGGTPPPEGGTPPPQEPQPDNVKDPFEKTPPSSPNDDENDNKGDDKGDDKEDDKKGDEKGDDKKGDDKKGDEKGDDKKGDDPEGKEDEPKDDPEGKGRNDRGGDKDSRGSSNNSNGEGSDAEFGDDNSDMQTLEELLKKIKDDFDSGKTSRDIQLNQDLDILENALSTPKSQIRDIFKTKAVVLSAIGRRNIFGTDNEQRLNDTLNEIFK
jgi:hypothetical protein